MTEIDWFNARSPTWRKGRDNIIAISNNEPEPDVELGGLLVREASSAGSRRAPRRRDGLKSR